MLTDGRCGLLHPFLSILVAIQYDHIHTFDTPILLFDLDGTLIDSSIGIYEAYKQALLILDFFKKPVSIKIFENNIAPTFSFVECILETGRTHQIRVHLSSKGNYILGDKQYKKKFKKIKNVDKELLNYINCLERQFLHAGFLGFDHPVTKKRVKFSSKLPKELSNILNKLNNT